MWNSILEILEQKVKEGSKSNSLYDDIGCMATLAGNYTKRLRKMGIDAHKFNKVIPRLTVAYNNRDHRKILVIDGQIGYTGGVNLADEYINHIERFGHWKDSAIRLDGRAVKALTRLFLMNWYINRGKSRILTATILKIRRSKEKGSTFPMGVDQNRFTSRRLERQSIKI